MIIWNVILSVLLGALAYRYFRFEKAVKAFALTTRGIIPGFTRAMVIALGIGLLVRAVISRISSNANPE